MAGSGCETIEREEWTGWYWHTYHELRNEALCNAGVGIGVMGGWTSIVGGVGWAIAAALSGSDDNRRSSMVQIGVAPGGGAQVAFRKSW